MSAMWWSMSMLAQWTPSSDACGVLRPDAR